MDCSENDLKAAYEQYLDYKISMWTSYINMANTKLDDDRR